jgi:hypothetical protein
MEIIQAGELESSPILQWYLGMKKQRITVE